MAIDTKAKRSSVMGIGTGWSLPPPDGTISVSDRAAAGWVYSGITYTAIIPSIFINIAQSIGRAIVRMIAFDAVSTRKDQQ